MKKTVIFLGLIIGLLTSCDNDDGGENLDIVKCEQDFNGDGVIDLNDCYTTCNDLNGNGFFEVGECF